MHPPSPARMPCVSVWVVTLWLKLTVLLVVLLIEVMDLSLAVFAGTRPGCWFRTPPRNRRKRAKAKGAQPLSRQDGGSPFHRLRRSPFQGPERDQRQAGANRRQLMVGMRRKRQRRASRSR